MIAQGQTPLDAFRSILTLLPSRARSGGSKPTSASAMLVEVEAMVGIVQFVVSKAR
jgi:hypothetical protein